MYVETAKCGKPICVLAFVIALAGWKVAVADDSAAWDAPGATVNAGVAAVNEGDLQLLADAAGRRVHRHSGEITIAPQSLHDGWVSMTQCHNDLDRVGEAQIVFHPERVRALRITRFANVDVAFVEANTVQLRGIDSGSEVCLYVETRALHRLDDGVYELRNGPFMRRFLDGYYPLQLQLGIGFPAELVLVDHVPAKAPGFDVRSAPGRVSIEALFEGRLRTVFRFRRTL